MKAGAGWCVWVIVVPLLIPSILSGDLPDDVIRLILLMSVDEDRLSLAMVCKNWSTVARRITPLRPCLHVHELQRTRGLVVRRIPVLRQPCTTPHTGPLEDEAPPTDTCMVLNLPRITIGRARLVGPRIRDLTSAVFPYRHISLRAHNPVMDVLLQGLPPRALAACSALTLRDVPSNIPPRGTFIAKNVTMATLLRMVAADRLRCLCSLTYSSEHVMDLQLLNRIPTLTTLRLGGDMCNAPRLKLDALVDLSLAGRLERSAAVATTHSQQLTRLCLRPLPDDGDLLVDLPSFTRLIELEVPTTRQCEVLMDRVRDLPLDYLCLRDLRGIHGVHPGVTRIRTEEVHGDLSAWTGLTKLEILPRNGRCDGDFVLPPNLAAVHVPGRMVPTALHPDVCSKLTSLSWSFLASPPGTRASPLPPSVPGGVALRRLVITPAYVTDDAGNASFVGKDGNLDHRRSDALNRQLLTEIASSPMSLNLQHLTLMMHSRNSKLPHLVFIISQLLSLRSLTLVRMNVTHSHLRILARMPALEHLELIGCGLWNEGYLMNLQRHVATPGRCTLRLTILDMEAFGYERGGPWLAGCGCDGIQEKHRRTWTTLGEIWS